MLALSSEIDTLPDLIRYLRLRELILSRKNLSPLLNELDFLAVYKTQPEIMDKAKREELDMLLIDEGLWEHYQKENQEEIKHRSQLNANSRLIDRIIEWIHKSIGFDPAGTGVPSDNGVKSYARLALELSSLNRLQRRMVGDKLLEKLRKADRTGQGYSVVRVSDDFGVLVLASNIKERRERAKWLEILSCVAYCDLELRKLVGIATEPFSEKYRSYDFFLIDKPFESKIAAALREKARELFGPKQPKSLTEYKGYD
ncbi:hypothetical protein DAT35_31775 [Vitiosangium sp. GDMCC 1.1324]|nr:hypothetical protein DAT35_31775 [Vitiosangium sp. GDMCC 1.1324]